MFSNEKIKLISAVAITVIFAACSHAGKNNTGDSYTYDMMYSPAFETYYLNPLLPDSIGALMPVKGTVPYVADVSKRDINLPYEMPNTPEGYELAITVMSPLNQKDATVLSEGKHFFEVYCTPCHGHAGNGLGGIVTSGKYTAKPPSYFDAGYIDMPDGKMFHSITFGKGQMQSYAQQVSKLERWEIIAYINSLQETYLAQMPVAKVSTDTTKTK